MNQIICRIIMQTSFKKTQKLKTNEKEKQKEKRRKNGA